MKTKVKAFLEVIRQNKRKSLIITGIVVVVIIIIIIASHSSSTKIKPKSLAERQEQLEKDPKLSKNVNNPRNNFEKGSYSLNKNESSIEWKYGDISGVIPVSSGKLIVTEKGRVGEFSVNASAAKTTVVGGDSTEIENFVKKNGSSITMNALTILPNTNDDAFTISFSLDALGKSTSLATGMFVKKLEKGVQVSGDITLDQSAVLKQNGFTKADKNLVLKVNYIFE